MPRHNDNVEDAANELAAEYGRWGAVRDLLMNVVSPTLSVLFIICFVPWSAWMTRQGFAVDRLTVDVQRSADLIEVNAQTRTTAIEKINSEISNLPPIEWRARVERLESYERENREAHADLKVGQAEMKVLIQGVAAKVGAVTGPPN